MSATQPATTTHISLDIEQMLQEISENAFAARLIIFNNDFTKINAVIFAILETYRILGKSCTIETATNIMWTAHNTGSCEVISGKVEDLQKAVPVFEKILVECSIVE